jgi:glycosyltransferase involved in cell wall biosynthesis
MATVSILIPNYNHARYLHQSLGGACGQTRPADEILIVDDGSTDGSVEIIQEFAARYGNVRFLQNDQNRGMQYTINRLLAEATSDYIVCAAADDELFPHFLEKHMASLARHPSAGMSVSEYVVLTTAGEVVNQSRAMPGSFGLAHLPRYMTAERLQEEFVDGYVWMTSNAIVARRDHVMAVGGFIAEQEWHSDWFTYYAIGLRHGVCIVPEGLGLIREAPGGYSDRGMKDRLRQARVLRAILDAASRPPNQDLRAIYRAAPGVLAVFGPQILEVMMRTPKYWDLAVSYGLFLARRHRRNTGRSFVVYALKRALR